VSAKPKQLVFQVTADKAAVDHLIARLVLVLRGACISIREVRVEL